MSSLLPVCCQLPLSKEFRGRHDFAAIADFDAGRHDVARSGIRSGRARLLIEGR